MRIALASGPAGFFLEEKLRVPAGRDGPRRYRPRYPFRRFLGLPGVFQVVAEAGVEEGAEGLMICATSPETA